MINDKQGVIEYISDRIRNNEANSGWECTLEDFLSEQNFNDLMQIGEIKLLLNNKKVDYKEICAYIFKITENIFDPFKHEIVIDKVIEYVFPWIFSNIQYLLMKENHENYLDVANYIEANLPIFLRKISLKVSSDQASYIMEKYGIEYPDVAETLCVKYPQKEDLSFIDKYELAQSIYDLYFRDNSPTDYRLVTLLIE